jgi:Uma2 family endonuclease
MTTATTPYIGLPLRGRVSGFRRFSVAEYHRLIDIGMLTENDDLELLDGHLVKKMSKGPTHDGTLSKVEKRILKIIPLGWDTRNQSVLTLTGSEPEPDLLVARVDTHDYMTRHPTVADVGLVIEVSNSTLETDREDKGTLYAANGIATYWIINVIDRQIEAYTDPVNSTPLPTYRTRTDYLPGQTIPLVLDGQTIAELPVADMLP